MPASFIIHKAMASGGQRNERSPEARAFGFTKHARLEIWYEIAISASWAHAMPDHQAPLATR